MRHLFYKTDLCVIGGGLSGVCAAISAARHGAKVILVQDRPVLGGNSSSEIRMWVGGAKGKDNRESGLIEEIECENYYYNKSHKFTMWDTVLYQKVLAEKNITLLLNTTCLDCDMKDNHINSIKCWQLNSETYHTIEAKYFADCSGDSIIAGITGAAHTYGREAKSDFNESIPPEKADKKTMGMSCLFQIRETDSPKPFIKPPFAYTYKSASELPFKDHKKLKDNNYWWIEYGGTLDCIHDTDNIREELLKIAYGIWDFIKNQEDHQADNWEMEWMGFLPGKRESRRYIGKYIVTENDVKNAGKHFDDIVAYGGWTMDDHFPEGFYHKESYPTIFHPAPSPWGIPFRALVHRDVDNLLFAGRNISVTHVALSSSRVMATCALLGQALGTAVSIMLSDNTNPDTIDIKKLQNTLMDDDCYLPFNERVVSEKNKIGTVTNPVLCNGKERGEDNIYVGKLNEPICYSFKEPVEINGVRLVFDSDLNRPFDNMPCTYNIGETRYNVAKEMIKDFDVIFRLDNGETIKKSVTNNFLRFIKIPCKTRVKKVELIPISTYGCDFARIYDFELY